MKTAENIAGIVVLFFRHRKNEFACNTDHLTPLYIRELTEMVAQQIYPVTETMLRERDGALHVGNGCELNVRGTAERLAYLESFPARMTADELSAHNRNMEELVKLRRYYADIIAALGHDNALGEIRNLNARISAAQEALRLRKELSE
jgi:hypothetical protein